MKFIENIRATFAQSFDGVSDDRGTVVETILMTAGFVVLTLLAVNWISTAALNKAADISGCIEGSNTYTNNNASAENCANQDHSGKDGNSFQDDSGYKKRFG